MTPNTVALRRVGARAQLEALAAHFLAGRALLFDRAFDLGLGGYPGVVGAEDPLAALTEHSVIADQRVHDRVLEGMTHVQDAGHVRRGDGDRVVVLGLALRLGMKKPGIQPFLGDAGLDLSRVVTGLGLEVWHRVESLGGGPTARRPARTAACSLISGSRP